jgi:hypothetical protein
MYLDLKSSLMLRLVAGALACFFIAAGLALFGTYRDVRQVNARVADLLARRLQIQLSHIESGIDAATRFPDFDLVSETSRVPVSACSTSHQMGASRVQAASGSIAILVRRPHGLLPSASGFQLRRPTLFVQFLIMISPMEVLS